MVMAEGLTKQDLERFEPEGPIEQAGIGGVRDDSAGVRESPRSCHCMTNLLELMME
jgi:hypothetical protein